ncbi:hypothetical protein J2Z22_004864, partial [Paenibacillus forsythiae]|nr:hypothetical protein [Paenibacillus forsythiae]
MSLSDATGVELKSPKKLTLTAGKEMTLFTPKKITIRSTSLIMAYQKGAKAGLSVENEYRLLGTTVQAKGSDQTSYPPFDDEPKEAEPPPPPPPEPFSWGELLKHVAVGLAVVAAVTAVAVLSVATLGTATM